MTTKAPVSSRPSPSKAPSTAINLSLLSTTQLSQLKAQLDAELSQLTSSFGQLRAAQQKFRDCIRSIAGGVTPAAEGKPILVPLTTSLYVPGTLRDGGKVIVEVGTGFYVEKTTADATKFYEAKVTELAVNLKDLEAIVAQKGSNLQILEDALRERVRTAK